MLNRIVICWLFLFFLCFLELTAQKKDSLKIDSVSITERGIVSLKKTQHDTIQWIEAENDKIDKETAKLLKTKNIFKPDSKKAVIYSAIFPGLGQIYNRKYWKLPIIYGGFVGLTYAITWNGRYYNDYTDGYKAIMSENPRSPEAFEKWSNLVSSGIDVNTISDGQIKTWQGYIKRKRNYFRRNRDLSIIGAVALYALSMIDAYVDAQLFDFDISPDLSLRVEPKVDGGNAFSQKTIGLQCSFTF